MNEEKTGVLAVVSGFSGSGKGTLMNYLLSHYDYDLSISATTRKPREGEEHGREYFFLTRDAFERMIENGEFIEYAQFVGNYYGTPKQYVKDRLAAGRNVLLEIEVQGAMQVKEQFPDALLVFVTPPSAEELKRRLVGRGTETMEEIARRLHRATDEAKMIDAYDVLLINDDLATCAEDLNRMIHDDYMRIPFEVKNRFNQELIEEIKRGLLDYRLGGTNQ
ncbi:MAG: guanylate kinase [Lachnospiraceae bacterium]|nr:guanylate kinase [Lachnospiraceae bacterium]